MFDDDPSIRVYLYALGVICFIGFAWFAIGVAMVGW